MRLVDERDDASERRGPIRDFLIMGGYALIAIGAFLIATGLLVHWVFVA